MQCLKVFYHSLHVWFQGKQRSCWPLDLMEMLRGQGIASSTTVALPACSSSRPLLCSPNLLGGAGALPYFFRDSNSRAPLPCLTSSWCSSRNPCRHPQESLPHTGPARFAVTEGHVHNLHMPSVLGQLRLASQAFSCQASTFSQKHSYSRSACCKPCSFLAV